MDKDQSETLWFKKTIQALLIKMLYSVEFILIG